MKLAIDETRCKGCNLCTKVCPYKIFKEGRKLNRKGIALPELDRPERCANCQTAESLRTADLRCLPAYLPGPGNSLD